MRTQYIARVACLLLGMGVACAAPKIEPTWKSLAEYYELPNTLPGSIVIGFCIRS